jgi:hypothetical protein
MLSLPKIFTVAALSFLLTAPASAASSEQPTPPPAKTGAPASEGVALQGTVSETMNSSGYTYLLLNTALEKIWVAIPETAIQTGQTVTCAPGMTMKDFTSKTLNRTFDTLVFSPGLEKGTTATATPAQPAAAKGTGGGGFNEALQAENNGGKTMKMDAGTADSAAMEASPGSSGAVVPSTAVNVNKATGPNSYSVGECFEQAKNLNSKTVRVRGKVMKVSRMIMGKNWLHIQDGTGNPLKNEHDLVVTTADEPAVDAVVTVEGTLSANRDFGAGYKYAVIIEDAKVEK